MISSTPEAGNRECNRPDENDAAAVADWLRVLIAPGQVAELRCLHHQAGGRGRPLTARGFFDSDHLDEMARQALAYTANSRGVYLTLNPLDPSLLARCCNRVAIAESGTAAADLNVTGRRWLLVDVDPVRDAHVSATDAEKLEARRGAVAVRDHLRSAGWPDPVIGDSGNGFHLLYRVELAADDGGTVKRALAALAKRFDSTAARVDRAVFNPSRIVKVPGTLARKGDSTADRPHRRAALLSVPEALQVVPAELLRVLAAEADEQPKRPAPSSNGTGHRLDVPRWLAARGRDVLSVRHLGDGRTAWNVVCPFNPSHTGTDSAVMQAADGALSAKCLHNECVGRGWREFKEAIGAPDHDHYDPPMQRRTEKRQTPASSNGEARRQPQPATAPDAVAGVQSGEMTGAEIILDYFRQRYQPDFRRGNAIHSAGGGEVAMMDACAGPDFRLIALLAQASDVPRCNDAMRSVRRDALPGFFAKWAKVAWAEMLKSLPEEDEADLGIGSAAAEEFRRLVHDAMLMRVTFGEVVKPGSAITNAECRSLIDWCYRWAQVGPWRDVRSLRCWCRGVAFTAAGNPLLRVAIRRELFAQLKADRRLCTMSSNRFGRLAARYGVGRSSEQDRPHGQRAVILDDAFVADLLASLPDEAGSAEAGR